MNKNAMIKSTTRTRSGLPKKSSPGFSVAALTVAVKAEKSRSEKTDNSKTVFVTGTSKILGYADVLYLEVSFHQEP